MNVPPAEMSIAPAAVSFVGMIALVGTYLAYRTTRRADDGTVKRGFKVGQIASAPVQS